MEENGKAVKTEAPEKPKKGRKRRDSVDSNKETAGAAAEKDTVAAGTETTENGKDSYVGTDTPPGPEPDAEPEDKAEPEPAAAEENGTESKEKEPESGAEPVTAAPVPVTESPLKRMKQEFQERSRIIREQMLDIQKAFITIGFQLHWIRENNMFRVLNYKSIYDYAEKEYGIKRTTCFNFISIIENYAERDENGEVIESIADCYRNYSASQLVAMLGMPDGMKRQVTPDMSVRAINRMRRGEDVEPDALPAGVEAPVPEKEPDIKEPPMENTEGTSAVIPEAEDTEPDIMGEKAAGPEESITEDTVPEPETDSMGITGAEPEERPGTTGRTEDNRGGAAGTLVEIDSYTGYRSIAGKIDAMIKQVFSASTPVKVKIVCEQG